MVIRGSGGCHCPRWTLAPGLVIWQALGLPAEGAELASTAGLDSGLSVRLGEVLAEQPATEAELRMLSERLIAWGRLLQGQLRASERRLEQLTADPASELGEIGAELHRVGALGPQLGEVRSLLVELDNRARVLRSDQLTRKAASSPLPAGELSPDHGGGNLAGG